MKVRKGVLAALLLTGIIILLVDTGSPLVNNPVCGRLVDDYGRLVSSRAPINIVHNPGLRPGVLSPAEHLLSRGNPAVLCLRKSFKP